MERNLSGSMTVSSMLHMEKSFPKGIPNRFLGFITISSISFSAVIIYFSTKWVHSSGKAVSRPTMPKALSLRPLAFSSLEWGA